MGWGGVKREIKDGKHCASNSKCSNGIRETFTGTSFLKSLEHRKLETYRHTNTPGRTPLYK